MKIGKKDMLLYAVTDRSWLAPGETLAQKVEQAAQGGVTCIQLREKHASDQEFIDLAKQLKPICAAYQLPLIINDNLTVAMAVDADGVHVGQKDMSLPQARALLGPDKIIGTSAHNVEEAKRAVEQGADYIGVGAVFGSSTKTDATYLSPQTLRAITQAVKIPVVAIGGINERNILSLHGSGVDGVAVVSAIFAQKDAALAAKRLRALSTKMVHGKLRCAIFDVDGTLTDSMYIWENAGSQLLKNHQIPAPPDLRSQLGPMTLRQTAAYFNQHYGLHETEEETMEEICKQVEDEYFYRVPAKAHVEKVLFWLRQQGIAICILTASERYHVQAACQRLGILKYFEKIFTCTELGMSKHDPNIFGLVCKSMGVKPWETVVFEDALHAVKTASDSGYFTVAVDDRYNQDKTEALQQTADWFIRDYTEIIEKLKPFVD